VIPEILPPVIETEEAACVAMEPRPRLVRAVVVLLRSDRLLAIAKKEPPETYAATQAEPMYIIIVSVAELK
jgi:hypothetical protein